MKISQRALQISPSLTLALTAKSKKLKEEGVDVVSFGAGEPDFNTPSYIIESAKRALDEGKTKYTPASGTVEIKKAICDKLQKDNHLTYAPENIVVSNGAKHSLANVFMAIVEEGDEVIVPTPYWLTYPELITLAGGKPIFVETKEENGFKITADELRRAITHKTVALVLNNPNNPTGAVYSKEEIYALAKVVEESGITVVSDEIYEMLNYTGKEIVSIASYSEKVKAQTIIVNGVSKSYAMTGWRIGFIACEAKVAKAISNMQSHMTSNPNSIAQVATVTAYCSSEGEKFLETMLASFSSRRALIMEKLTENGFEFIRPDGAFYALVKVSQLFGKKYNGKQINTAHELASTLLDEKAVTVIPCESFGASEYVRLSYAISEDDIVKGVDRMGEFAKAMED